MRILSSREELKNHQGLPATEAVFLAFRPTVADFLDVVRNYPGIKQVRLAGGHEKTLPRATRKLLVMNGIKLVPYTIQGQRTDTKGSIMEVDE